jgi:hypothetical protein
MANLDGTFEEVTIGLGFFPEVGNYHSSDKDSIEETTWQAISPQVVSPTVSYAGDG